MVVRIMETMVVIPQGGNRIKENTIINRDGTAGCLALLAGSIFTMVLGTPCAVIQIMEAKTVSHLVGNRIKENTIINRDGIADFHPILVGGIFIIANGIQLMETQIVGKGKDTIQVEGEGVNDAICSNIGKIKNSFFR